MAGLYMAHAEGLQFGKDVVFTYGPLGFLQDPVLYDQGMWILAFLFQVAVHVAVAVSLLWSARRALPLGAAVIVSYVLLVIGELEAAAVLLAFIWCFVALDDRAPKFAVPLVVIGGGVLAAIELQVKANFGIAILGMAVVAVLGLSNRRRNVPLFAAVAIGTFAVCWLAGGQDLSNIPLFVSRSAQVVSGYSAAMGTDIAAQRWERLAAPFAIALLMGGTAVATWRDPLQRRLASMTLVALFSYMTFKQGFVRQGLGNTPEFFVLMACAGIVVASRFPRSRFPRFRFHLAALALVLPLGALAVEALPTSSIWRSLKAEHHVEYLRQDLDALLRPGERRSLAAEARRSLRASYRLDPSILRAMQGRSVHIDPWEISVAWAYGLDWHPLPVIQSYSAYTPQLDRINADALRGADAPQMILRHRNAIDSAAETSVDDRFPGWESPAAMRAMLCDYRVVRTTDRWQLLEWTGNRCGIPRPIGVTHASTGKGISIPSPPGPRDMVFARIDGIEVDGWEDVRTALYRARPRTAILGAHRTWRLVPATAGDGLTLRASRRVDFPGPFGIAPDSSTISLAVDGGGPRALTVHFFAQRIGAQSSRVGGR